MKKILVKSRFKSSRFKIYVTLVFNFLSTPRLMCYTSLKLNFFIRGVVLLYIEDPNDQFLQPAEIRKRLAIT